MSDRKSYYWKFDRGRDRLSLNGTQSDNTDASFGPAPRLAPINGTNGMGTHVDVRDDHHWTESPRSSRGEVPVLTLKENFIDQNVAINQLSNYGMSIKSAATDIKQALGNTDGFLETVSEGLKMKRTATGPMKDVDPMRPYDNLYTLTPSKFVYSLPYMENRYVSTNNQFGETGDAGRLIEGARKFAEITNEALQTINLNKSIAPGRMIEVPKAFTFSGREKSYTCSFPLFNTKSYDEIVKNWQFIFLLSYQNTPNRINRDLIDPPCIYESYIPGVWYSRYSAITNMTVEFVGARREMMIEVMAEDSITKNSHIQSTGGKTGKPMLYKTLAVIPDAYQVTITVTELFAETQNMKFQMLLESMNSRIQTGAL